MSNAYIWELPHRDERIFNRIADSNYFSKIISALVMLERTLQAIWLWTPFSIWEIDAGHSCIPANCETCKEQSLKGGIVQKLHQSSFRRRLQQWAYHWEDPVSQEREGQSSRISKPCRNFHGIQGKILVTVPYDINANAECFKQEEPCVCLW